MILAVMVSANFFFWREAPGQVGIAIGHGASEHLLALIPTSGCSAGIKLYAGRPGELEAATNLLAHSKICSLAEQRQQTQTKR